jgi:hypothetical protein
VPLTVTSRIGVKTCVWDPSWARAAPGSAMPAATNAMIIQDMMCLRSSAVLVCAKAVPRLTCGFRVVLRGRIERPAGPSADYSTVAGIFLAGSPCGWRSLKSPKERIDLRRRVPDLMQS